MSKKTLWLVEDMSGGHDSVVVSSVNVDWATIDGAEKMLGRLVVPGSDTEFLDGLVVTPYQPRSQRT